MPALDALMRYPIRDRLERIAVPTLIVWGRNDMTVPVADAAEFERLIGANARTVILEDTGHLPMLERPRVFNPILLATSRTGADAAQRVTAPSDALLTSFAYFVITPSANAGAGAS